MLEIAHPSPAIRCLAAVLQLPNAISMGISSALVGPLKPSFLGPTPLICPTLRSRPSFLFRPSPLSRSPPLSAPPPSPFSDPRLPPPSLLQDHFKLQLCDFGCSKRLIPGKPNIFYICALFYRAPELLLGSKDYSVAVDMWSFGCVLAELILGCPMFANEASTYQQLIEVLKVKMRERGQGWRDSFSRGVRKPRNK